MSCALILSNVVVLITSVNSVASPAHFSANKVLYVDIDGFRFDYVKVLDPKTSALLSIAERGVSAPVGIKNSFTTKSFPNHYTMVTGLFQESHGVLGNEIYDMRNDKVAHLDRDTSDYAGSFFRGEPIWATYVKERPERPEPLCIMVAGCAYNISGVKLATAVPYKESVSFRERIDSAVGALQAGVELVVVYYHEPDHVAHQFGTKSSQLVEAVREVDNDIAYLLDLLSSTDLLDSTNLVVVSDHGMSDIIGNDIVPVNPDLYEIVLKTDVLFYIKPNEGKTVMTMEFLESAANRSGKFKVYLREQLPERWHYKYNVNVPPIVVVAEPGILLWDGVNPLYPQIATHGYDNELEDMRPAFFAAGPDIIQRQLGAEDFHNVDIYNLLCLLLGLQHSTPNNGTAKHARELIRSGDAYPVAVFSLFAVLLAVACVLLHRASRRRQIRYTRSGLAVPATASAAERAGYVLASAASSDSDFESEDELFLANFQPGGRVRLAGDQQSSQIRED